MVAIKGYSTYRLDRCCNPNSQQKRGGGLIVYVKNTSSDVYVQEVDSSSTQDIKVQWLKIARANSKTILLANVYKPPLEKVEKAVKILEQGLGSLHTPNNEVVILGDFNIDYKNKKSPNYKRIKFFERSNLLEQLICTTTRNTKTSSSLLDMAFIKMKHISQAGTLDSFISDHQPIFIIKKKEKNRGKMDLSFDGRSYRHYNKQVFSDNISSKNWTSFYDAPTPSEAWKEMLYIITAEADKQCPVKHFKIRNSKPCWLTNELIEQMRYRDYFYRKAKKLNNEDDWNIAKFHRNQVNFNIRKGKAE